MRSVLLLVKSRRIVSERVVSERERVVSGRCFAAAFKQSHKLSWFERDGGSLVTNKKNI
jgi:hypothetical protein